MSMAENLMNFDLGYIRAQGKYGTDFNELQAIFTVKILAMIYAQKLRQKLYSQPPEMRNDASELVKYIKTSFLLINPKLKDIQKSQTEKETLSEGSTPITEILLEASLPETQSDGSKKKMQEPPKNMFRSTAMNLLENLIEMIANANPKIEAEAIEELHQPIDSFIQTVPSEGEVIERWLFIEISYSEMLKLYPEKDIIPPNSESSWSSQDLSGMSYFF
ncbi:hypothetical protein V9T40_000904 [Parthenolecanium corni]|uniref:Uncharacterized protein n=1 Tax=Parthenolecanium corni TaxID=536013 RepID=A0AAN9TAM3_9HEMI